MNIEEYIESGILELYVADLLSATKRSEVERLMSQHAEIRDEVSFLRSALEQAASAPPPPSHIRDNIKRKISSTSSDIARDKTERPLIDAKIGRSGPGIIMPVLLLVALAGMTYLWVNQKSYVTKISDLERNAAIAQNIQDSLSLALVDCNKKVTNLSSGNMKPIFLAATEGSPEMKVKVFHDGDGTQCFIDETTVPAPPTGQQYQLWALVGDQPTDLGIIDFGKDADPLSALNCVAGATAYAITLEPLGGSLSPTLTALTAVGAI